MELTIGMAVTAKSVGAIHGGELSRALILVPLFVVYALYATAKMLYSSRQKEFAFVDVLQAAEPEAFHEGDTDLNTDAQIDEALAQSLWRAGWWEVRWIDAWPVRWLWELIQNERAAKAERER
jgi:hypothetical protein